MLGFAVAVALLAAALAPGVASADLPNPVNLRVIDGPGWQPVDDFSVAWNEAPSGTIGIPVQATVYGIYDSAGRLGGGEFVGDPGEIHHIQVPDRAGHYTLVLWLRSERDVSAQASVALDLDDVAPAPPLVAGPAGWIEAGESAEVKIDFPSALPLSGLRGYAVSLERGASIPPCASGDRCTAAETDLLGSAGSISVGPLSEGSYTVTVCAVSGSGRPSSPVTTTVRVDASRPGVALAGLPEGWSPGPVTLTALATDPLSGMAPEGAGGPFTAIAVDAFLPKRAFGAAVVTVVAGDGIHRVAFWGRDATGNSGEPGVSLAPPASALVRIDGTDPTVGFADAQDRRDPERIDATVADPLSGPDPARGSIGVRPAGSERPFRPLPTASATGHLTARWSSDDYPRGLYEFRATGFDRAGNATAATTRADGSPMVLAAPLKAPVSLQFGFGGRRLVWQRCDRVDGGRRCHREVVESFRERPAQRTVPGGHGVTVGGRLRSATGAGLRGRPVQVVETFAAGSRIRSRRTTVRTGPDGRFLTRLGPGPSRRVDVGFAGDQLLSRQAGRQLRLAVRAGVRLRVSTSRASIGGAPVVFSGRIAHPEAQVPRAGLPVQLQFRLPGRPWEEFRTLQTDAAGRFRYPYAFTDDDSAGVRFLFRAYAPPSGRWPFAPGTSRPLAVTGR